MPKREFYPRGLCVAVAVLVACFSAAAHARAIPVDVVAELNGLDVKHTVSSGQVTVLALKNDTPVNVECSAELNSGLATPVTRRSRMMPGKAGTISFTVKEDSAKLKILLRCLPGPTGR